MIQFWAARKNVDGGVLMFGPGVDGHVGFRDDDHSADAPRTEFVEQRFDDGATALFDGVDQRFAHERDSLEKRGIALMKLDKGVEAQAAGINAGRGRGCGCGRGRWGG